MRYLFAILLSFAVCPAYSQQPPQVPQVKAEKETETSPKNQNNPQADHQPANFYKRSPATNTNTYDATKQSEHGDDGGTEFWPPFYGYRIKITDSLLVFFTFILSIFTGLLWRSTEKLWGETKATSVIAEKQMALAGMQADLAEKQHGLQRWQYLTTHRPRLIIRRISLDEGDGNYFTPGRIHPKIQFIIANIGGSRATIIESNATFARLDGLLPAIPPYSMETNAIKCIVREAGQSDPPEFLAIEDREIVRIIGGWKGCTITSGYSSPFYFFGYIQYRDDIDIVRRMTFCRRYNPAIKRFIDVNDPEYEYAD